MRQVVVVIVRALVGFLPRIDCAQREPGKVPITRDGNGAATWAHDKGIPRLLVVQQLNSRQIQLILSNLRAILTHCRSLRRSLCQARLGTTNIRSAIIQSAPCRLIIELAGLRIAVCQATRMDCI